LYVYQNQNKNAFGYLALVHLVVLETEVASSLHAAVLRQKWQWASWLKITLLSWPGPH